MTQATAADHDDGDSIGGDDEVRVRSEVHDSVSLRSCSTALGLHQPQRAHAAAQDFVAHGGEMQGEEQQREGDRP